jgi:hypothetical protein
MPKTVTGTRQIQKNNPKSARHAKRMRCPKDKTLTVPHGRHQRCPKCLAVYKTVKL